MKKLQIKYLNHCAFNLYYHLVIVTKYRRKCITASMLARLKIICDQLTKKWDGELIEFNGESDHLHQISLQVRYRDHNAKRLVASGLGGVHTPPKTNLRRRRPSCLNPKVAPSVFVNNLKTVTSRLIRKEFSEHLKKVYWKKPVFWRRTYCILSCGGAPLSIIKQYIEQQNAPE